MIEEDKFLFLSEMTDVSPLKPQNTSVQYQQESFKKQALDTVKAVKKRQRMQMHAEKAELDMTLSNTTRVASHESIQFHQKGIRLQDFTKLKKGAYPNQAQLDLHGYTQDQAHTALVQFITSAYQEKLRYVRIVHGKGYNSEDAFPVLKNLVNQSLRTLTAVLAFCSAPEKDGGAGAVNVLLKKRNDSARRLSEN
ncbi:MAG: Smr/MutS family endonuclease [Thiomicrorhabdus sp.]|nr:Smr/MutS family endonuclease [Thiomicrorhabdus sp.]